MILFYRYNVKTEEAEKLKDTYSIDLFLETSAKNGFNVYELFFQAAKILYENFSVKKEINKVNKYIKYLFFINYFIGC